MYGQEFSYQNVFLYQDSLISSSDSETEDDKGQINSEKLAELLEDVIKPLSKLNVDAGNHGLSQDSF